MKKKELRVLESDGEDLVVCKNWDSDHFMKLMKLSRSLCWVFNCTDATKDTVYFVYVSVSVCFHCL